MQQIEDKKEILNQIENEFYKYIREHHNPLILSIDSDIIVKRFDRLETALKFVNYKNVLEFVIDVQANLIASFSEFLE
jgi:hypothetical protein